MKQEPGDPGERAIIQPGAREIPSLPQLIRIVKFQEEVSQGPEAEKVLKAGERWVPADWATYRALLLYKCSACSPQ